MEEMTQQLQISGSKGSNTHMKRVIIAVMSLAAVAVAVVLWPRGGKRVPQSLDLTVHFTCDTIGRLEPCGCFSGQHGGLTRLKSWLAKNPPPGPAVNVDIGGALAGPEDYDLIQHRYLTRAFASMGFHALNVGGREASIPATALKTMAAASAVPMISASVVDAASREPLLPAYRVVEAGGRRIGILGVVSPRSVPAPGEGIAVLALNEAVDRHLPELAARCDLVMLLAFANEEELRLLARDYFEFALILGGDVPSPSQELVRENDSLILFTTNQGRTVGTFAAKVSAGPRVTLTDPRFEIELLWERIPQHEEMRALVREFRKEVRDTKLAVDDPLHFDPGDIPGVKRGAGYVGSAACVECHQQAAAVWKKSGHSHAFRTLVEKGADADPHCVRCHTIGFGVPGGYRREFADQQLIDVGCESCHGPGSPHIDRLVHHKPNQFKFRPLGAADCTICHYGEFSRPFEWDEFWQPIKHGKE